MTLTAQISLIVLLNVVDCVLSRLIVAFLPYNVISKNDIKIRKLNQSILDWFLFRRFWDVIPTLLLIFYFGTMLLNLSITIAWFIICIIMKNLSIGEALAKVLFYAFMLGCLLKGERTRPPHETHKERWVKAAIKKYRKTHGEQN